MSEAVPGSARSLWSAGACTDLACELIAATNHGPDEAAVRESLAQRLHLGLQIVLLDDTARPGAA